MEEVNTLGQASCPEFSIVSKSQVVDSGRKTNRRGEIVLFIL